MKKPSITVVMPVYNSERFLAKAIESILSQDLADFEFVIIDDGSSDKSADILANYAKKDKRIKLINHSTNKGLVDSLNAGIKAAKGEYIARQDADDLSMPQRLQRQLEFLQDNQGIVAVGSSIKVMGGTGKILHRHPLLLNDPELRQELLIRSPFAHGSVMFRKDAAIKAGLYDETSWPAEDYDFWLRLSALGELANLDEDLYTYREHLQSISSHNKKLQNQKSDEIRNRAWQENSRLLPTAKINLKIYKKLDMGEQRIERIVDNTTSISKFAIKKGDPAFALKNLSLIAASPQIYKKAVGKIKRRLA